MLKKLIIWGAGGHAKVLRQFTESIAYELSATFDNDRNVPPPFSDVPLYYGREGFKAWRSEHPEAGIACLVAIGGACGGDRLEILDYLEQHDCDPVTVIHPTAFVADDAVLEMGVQVLAGATVCTKVAIGRGSIINTSASVDHETVLEEGVHVAPGATLAGCVSVGAGSMIAIGAVVLPSVRIGCHTIVGAGSVVTRDVPDDVVVYGNPAKVIRNNV